jgi:hypothetical protein
MQDVSWQIVSVLILLMRHMNYSLDLADYYILQISFYSAELAKEKVVGLFNLTFAFLVSVLDYLSEMLRPVVLEVLL